MDIIGDKHYTGLGVNPPSDKQEFIMGVIADVFKAKFIGSTTRDAYSFIGMYHEYISLRGNDIYVRRTLNEPFTYFRTRTYDGSPYDIIF